LPPNLRLRSRATCRLPAVLPFSHAVPQSSYLRVGYECWKVQIGTSISGATQSKKSKQKISPRNKSVSCGNMSAQKDIKETQLLGIWLFVMSVSNLFLRLCQDFNGCHNLLFNLTILHESAKIVL